MALAAGFPAAVMASLSAVVLSLAYSRAAQHADALVVLVGIQLVALPIACMVLAVQWRGITLSLSPKAVLWIALVALAAVSIDLFSLLAYGAGMTVSTMRPLVTGVSIAGTTVIGIALGEQVSPLKVAGMVAVIGGAIAISWES